MGPREASRYHAGLGTLPLSEAIAPMTDQRILRPRMKHARRRVAAAFLPSAAVAVSAGGDFPMTFYEPDAGKSAAATGAISAALHLAIIGALVFFAALVPEVIDEIIPVQLIQEEPPKPPAPARKALAERRRLDFAPAVQAVQPQIVNPRVIADAVPVVNAEVLQMDAVNTATAPTQVTRSSVSVDRVSAVGTIGGYQASNVDIGHSSGPVVRGPVRAGTVGPSVGPRKVVGTSGTSVGTGSLAIGGGSSVREGILSSRDVVGSPTGAALVSVDTAVGSGNLSGPGGNGTGLLPGGVEKDCLSRPEVQGYMTTIHKRMYSRWTLPRGLADKTVTLRFAIDVAGSASSIQLVQGDNALGASAIDAMRTASPFPPMPDRARCLAKLKLKATFSSSSVAG
jgi:TonB family protein